MRHRLRTVHHTKGRLRLKVPAARANPAVFEEICRSISSCPGVTGVRTNLRTGSILVQYSSKAGIDFHEQLTDHGEKTGGFLLEPPELTEVDEMAHRIELEAEFLSQHSETARVIVDSVKRLDTRLKLATHNTVDLKVLLPMGLAVYSVAEIGLEASTPLWVTLGIFSFNSFVALHHPVGAVGLKEEISVSHPAASANKEEVETPEPARKKDRRRR
jgi:hypothetical protein